MSTQGSGLLRSGGLRAAALALAVSAIAASTAHAGATTSGIYANQVGGSFREPVSVAFAPGSPSLAFVIEKRGVVRVMRNGTKLRRPFLDIRRRVSAQGEQGLLSIAFPPNYASSGRFYAYFTNRGCRRGTGGCDIEIAEFRRKRGTAVRANERSHRRVLRIAHRDAPNHNGGTAAFGPDGKLWIATGDGGGGNDTFDNARRRSSLLGKLLRIDPRKPRARRARLGYRVPADNPFVNAPGRDEIWSIGLRNPFRFSFDAPQDAIAIGDVGQDQVEEVDFVTIADARGANFGWPQYEGDQLNDPTRPGPGPLIPPVFTYTNGGTAAVIGGVVLRDPRFEGVPDADPGDGIYIFGDAYSSPLERIEPNLATNTYTDYQILPNAPVGSVGGFGVDSALRIWLADRGAGTVLRLDPTD